MKHLKSTRIMKRKAKPVERAVRRRGIELDASAGKPATVNPERFQAIRNIGRMIRLMIAGWMPTELGLWMKRTKWAGGSITETYNLATAYQKQFEPGRNNQNPKEKGRK
jgi:hypothetical protein